MFAFFYWLSIDHSAYDSQKEEHKLQLEEMLEKVKEEVKVVQSLRERDNNTYRTMFETQIAALSAQLQLQS